MEKRICHFMHVILLIALSLFISGCGGNTPETETKTETLKSSTSQTPATWTVMTYLCGTDLESIYGFATDNIQEMLRANQNDEINIIIETGGAEQWWTDVIDNNSIQRFHIQNHKLIEDMKLNNASMGDNSTLSSFIKWGAKNYPADKYMLLLWDHGGGSAIGVCYDELYDDFLSLRELRQAVEEANIPFELVGLDACLMGSLETAEAFQGYAHYMVASEELEPGAGWAYTKILNALSQDPNCNGEKVGKAIVDSYFEKLESQEFGDNETLSLIDLTKIPVLSAAFKELSNDLVLSTQDFKKMQSVSRGVSRCENFGGNNDVEGYTNMVDLGDLLENTKDVLPSATKVKAALSDAVTYEKHGAFRSNASGLSILYPLNIDNDCIEEYSSFSDNLAYIQYLSIIENEYDSEEWVDEWLNQINQPLKPGVYDNYFDSGIGEGGYSFDYDEDSINELQNLKPLTEDDYDIDFYTSINDDGYFTLKITSGLEAVSDVLYNICINMDEEGYIVLGLGSDIDVDYDSGTFIDNFRGVWLGFDDQLVYAETIENTNEYTLYSIPCLYNNKHCTVRTAYNYDKKEYSVIGLYEDADEDTGMASKTAKKLEAGDHLEFLFPWESWDGEDAEDDGFYVLTEITWKDDTVFGEIPLDDGVFIYNFVISDIYGNLSFSEDAIIEITDGEIEFFEIEDPENLDEQQ